MNGIGVMQGIKVGLLQCDNVMCTKEDPSPESLCTVYCVLYCTLLYAHPQQYPRRTFSWLSLSLQSTLVEAGTFLRDT